MSNPSTRRARYSEPALHALALALAGAGLVSLPPPAWAQASASSAAAQQRTFDVPAGNAEQTLPLLAQQAQVNLVFTADAVRGVRTNAVRGNLAFKDALEALLAGTPLRAEAAGQGWVVRPLAGGEALDADVQGQRIVITGTNVRGAESVRPAQRISRDELVRRGVDDAESLARALPGSVATNTASTVSATSNNNGFGTAINLRGQGSASTLTLLNGRRLAPAGGARGGFADISAIPLAAVERVEVLGDSASAIYGSDAVGGVVNFILRRHYDGVETSLRWADGKNGGDSVGFNLLGGMNWTSGQLVAALATRKQDPVLSAPIGFTSTDLRARGGSDWRSQGFGRPGQVYDITGQGLPGTGAPFAAIPAGQNGSNLQASQLIPFQFVKSDSPAETLLPKERQAAGYLHLSQDLGPRTALTVDLLASERRNDAAQGTAIPVFVIVPPTNPFNKLGVPVQVGYTPSELQGLSSESRTRVLSLSAALSGDFGPRSWSWEVAVSHGRDETRGLQAGVPVDEAFAAAAASSNPANAFNPFGDGSLQPAASRTDLYADTVTNTLSRSTAIQASVSGTLFALPGGPAKAAFGAQWREEGLRETGSQGGVPAPGGFFAPGRNDTDRNAQALFGELLLPLAPAGETPGLRRLDLTAAVRHERYSDFGSKTTPQLALAWSPLAGWTARASWGRAFRAPLLAELNRNQFVLPNQRVVDPRNPGPPVLATLVIGGNPALQPETASTWRLGLSYAPAPQFAVDIAAFHIDYSNRIKGFNDGLRPDYLLANEAVLPAGVVERDSAGRLLRVVARSQNVASLISEGAELAARGALQFGAWRLEPRLELTYFSRQDESLVAGAPVDSLVGRVGFVPRWCAGVGVTASTGPWAATLTWRQLGEQSYAYTDPNGRRQRQTVGSYGTLGLVASWTSEAKTGWAAGWRAMLGISNLLDEKSPFVDSPSTAALDLYNHDLRGRTVSLQIAKAF